MRFQRFPGKPTSGRYVYRPYQNLWCWQCDLHDGPDPYPYEFSGEAPTMPEAFALAMQHALACGETNEFEGEKLKSWTTNWNGLTAQSTQQSSSISG